MKACTKPNFSAKDLSNAASVLSSIGLVSDISLSLTRSKLELGPWSPLPSLAQYVLASGR
jgi:hypothetical protein